MKKYKKILRIVVYFFLILLVIGIIYSIKYFQQISTQNPTTPSYPLGEYERRAIAQVSDSNGMKEYLKATLAFDSISFLGNRSDKPENRPNKLVDKVLKEGWNQDFPQLNIVLEKNKEALDLIKAGSKKGYATLPKMERPSYSMPYPIPGAFYNLGKLLVAEAYKYQFQKNYSRAVEDWLIAIQLGQSYGGENSWLIGKLISMSIESYGYRALEKFLKENPNQSEKFYEDLIERLDKIQKNEKTPKYAFEFEHQAARNNIEELSKSPKTFFLLFQKGKILRNMDGFYKEYINSMDKPYTETKGIDWWGKIEKLDRLNRIMAPNFLYTDTRHRLLKANSAITEIGASIQYYKIKNGHYPDSLDELSPSIVKEIPKDPFADKPFIYSKTDRGFELYSLGPDLMDDKASILYDPTNGTTSAGDIVF